MSQTARNGYFIVIYLHEDDVILPHSLRDATHTVPTVSQRCSNELVTDCRTQLRSERQYQNTITLLYKRIILTLPLTVKPNTLQCKRGSADVYIRKSVVKS